MRYDDDPRPEAVVPAPPPERPRRRLWRRTGFWLTVAIAGCLAVFGGRYGYRHWQVAGELRTALEARDREEPGWRLADLEAARGVIPDQENAALRVEEAYILLPHRHIALGIPFIRPLSAQEESAFHTRLEELPPNERPTAADLALLQQELQPKQAAVDKARELADLPRGRFTVQLKRNTWDIRLPQCIKVDDVARQLTLDALVRAEDGDTKGALRDCRAALNAARALGDEPFALAQQYRGTAVDRARRAVERVLAQGENDPDDLLALQQLLQDEARFPRLLVAARGERAVVNELLEAVEAGDVSLGDFNDGLGHGSVPSLAPFVSLDEIRAEHAQLLRLMTEAVEIARLPPHQRAGPIAAHKAKLDGLSPRTLVNRLLYKLEMFDALCRRTDARLRCLVAALAVERYRRLHGGWPEALNDLTPPLAADIAADPEDGEPLGYRRYPDRVVVYSRLALTRGPVGDRQFDPTAPSAPGVGVAVHLFDVAHRRQPPPSHAATDGGPR